MACQIVATRQLLGEGEAPSFGAFSRELWIISRDNLPFVDLEGSVDDYLNAVRQPAQVAEKFRSIFSENSLLGPSNFMELRQETYKKRSVIEWTYFHDGEIASDLYDAHSRIIFFEGLRQQLLARKGIICPSNSKGRIRCRCSKTIHDGLSRLSGLAADGLFGSGEWSPLPCKR